MSDGEESKVEAFEYFRMLDKFLIARKTIRLLVNQIHKKEL